MNVNAVIRASHGLQPIYENYIYINENSGFAETLVNTGFQQKRPMMRNSG